MKDFLFTILVILGRLFMASLFLLMVIIAIPICIFAALAVLFDAITEEKFKRAQTEYID